MNNKSWNLYLISIVLSTILILAMLNWAIDPFNIFDSKILKKDYQLNERFCKIRYLNSKHSLYNGYIFGSSRVAATPPDLLEKYLPGHKFYNMTVAGCTQYDNLMFLKYFIEKEFNISTLYLQVDIPDVHGFNPLAINQYVRHHPDLTKESILAFYSEFLTSLPLKNFLGKMSLNHSKQPSIKNMRYDIENSGRWYIDHANQLIKNNPEYYISLESSFHEKYKTRNQAGKHLKENINALKEIKKLAQQHKIDLIVFVPPYHHLMMDSFNQHSYIQYLSELSEITDFWDFSSYHPITFNNYYYYSQSYFTPALVKLMLARIFNDTSVEIPHDFGVKVNKNNIVSHLQYKNEEIALRDIKKLESIAAYKTN